MAPPQVAPGQGREQGMYTETDLPIRFDVAGFEVQIVRDRNGLIVATCHDLPEIRVEAHSIDAAIREASVEVQAALSRRGSA